MGTQQTSIVLAALIAGCAPEFTADTSSPDAGGHAGGDAASGASPPLAFADGARLAARGFVSPDDPNVRLLEVWHDNTLAIDCLFDRGLDGVWRCLPTEQAYRRYESANCSDDPFKVDVYPDDCTRRFVTYTVWRVDGCLGEWSLGVIELVDEATNAQVVRFRDSANNCRSTEDLPPGPHTYCHATEASLDLFVTADLQPEDVGARVRLRLDGEDGSFQIMSRPSCSTAVREPQVRHYGSGRLASIWYFYDEETLVPETGMLQDTQLGFACHPRVREDGGVHCWPVDAATSVLSVYADAECSELVGHAIWGVTEASQLPPFAASAATVFSTRPRETPTDTPLYFDDRLPGNPHHFFRCQPFDGPAALFQLTPLSLAELVRLP